MPTTPGASRNRDSREQSFSREQRSCVVFNSNTPNGGNIAQIESANASSQTPPLTAPKANNIPPRQSRIDRNQLEQKIEQIREYIKVTSTMMQHLVSEENQVKFAPFIARVSASSVCIGVFLDVFFFFFRWLLKKTLT